MSESGVLAIDVRLYNQLESGNKINRVVCDLGHTRFEQIRRRIQVSRQLQEIIARNQRRQSVAQTKAIDNRPKFLREGITLARLSPVASQPRCDDADVTRCPANYNSGRPGAIGKLDSKLRCHPGCCEHAGGVSYCR